MGNYPAGKPVVDQPLAGAALRTDVQVVGLLPLITE